MTKTIIYLAIAASIFFTKAFAQENFENRAKIIANTIENITKQEKEALKTEVEAVNMQLDKKEITQEQAAEKKQQLSDIRAKNIENKVKVEQQKLTELVQEKVDGKINEIASTKNKRYFSVSYGKNDTLKKRENRTTSQLVFAMGLNNATTNNAISNSEFRYFGSHFYEIGLTANTRLSKTNNLMHIKYGVSTVWNNLRPTDNQEFVVAGNQTNLQTSAIKLEDSRLRNVYLTFPLHLEFDFSGKTTENGVTYFKSHDAFRFGLGGYAGINLETSQYSETSFNKYYSKNNTDGDYNTSNFIYGLSTYVGYKSTSLYLKYDLNPLFKNNIIKQNNVSLGIRWDFN